LNEMTEFDGAYPSRLNQVRIPIISNSDCAAQYPTFTILGSQMCAGDLATGGVDTCLVCFTWWLLLLWIL